MKRKFLPVLYAIACCITIGSAQNNSKWIYNISEGLGSPVANQDDELPEIAVSGNTVHTLWLTPKSQTRELNYRRSVDQGIQWEAKITLVDTDFDRDRRYTRMAVSGNFVHIFANRGQELWYFRSVNGGASFEAVRVVYSVTNGYIYNLNVAAQGSNVYATFTNDCWYCGEKKWLYLLKSEDAGSSFTPKLMATDKFDTYTQFTSLHINGSNLYSLYLETIGNWWNYDYALHFISSNDDGNTFNDQIISIPAKSGNPHSFWLQDGNNGYHSKIASDGQTVWVIWSGWDQNDTARVFIRKSQNAGRSFGNPVVVSGSVSNIHAGLETIAGSGNNVHIIFTTTENNLYVNSSIDGGNSFKGVKELTDANARFLESGFEPQLLIDPKDGGAFVVTTGLKYAKILPDGQISQFKFIGTMSSNTRRPKFAIANNGQIHIVSEAGGEWLQTGSFTDIDIWYRRIDPNFADKGQSDKSLKLGVFPNAGDGSGYHRFDQMIIAPDLGQRFRKAMTIEFWVKLDSVEGIQRILNQVHKNVWNFYEPKSFEFGSNEMKKPICALVTSTGAYTITGSKSFTPGYWNHMAIVYEDNNEANNFKLVLNGQIIASATAVGELMSSGALWIVGSISSTHFTEGFRGGIDELRFWSVARTPDEIQANRFQKLAGNESDLEAYYSFDAVSPFGEVSDLTGHGHLGNLTYQEETIPSEISNLGAKFEYIQSVSNFSFFQKSKGGTQFSWDFGDGQKSKLVNPFKHYDLPGVYNVCMDVYGRKMFDSYCEEVEVEGIARFFPLEGGNTGEVTLYLYGGGFNGQQKVHLRRAGYPDIEAKRTIYDSKKTLTAVLDLNGKTIGDWEVIVVEGNKELKAPATFRIVPGQVSDPFVAYSGGGNILMNRWTPQTITLGNRANVDAHGVLLWVSIPEANGNELEFINLNILPPQLAIDRGWADQLRSYGNYMVMDDINDPSVKNRVYALYFATLPAKSSFDLSVRIKLAESSKPVPIQIWLSPPFYQSPLSTEVQACVALSTAKALLKAGAGFIPGLPCLTGTLAVISDFSDQAPLTPSVSDKVDTRHWGWILGTNLLECAGSLTGWNVVIGITTLITSGIEAAQDNSDCYSGFRHIGLMDILYFPLSSLDPNEKNGNPGIGLEGFINKQSSMSYQIRFENKSSATAPAQEVNILDTLRFPKFDLNEFSFGSCGWGDRIYYPLPKSSEFSIDVDLRPDKNGIVRVSGKLDTIAKVVKWNFITLDPNTMDLVVDPLGGFLPPNVSSPEGEGFVNFTVGLSNQIQHRDRIQNQASIIFDVNNPIITNLHQNTFDLGLPQSNMRSLISDPRDTTIVLELLSNDADSKVRFVEIWVSENDSIFRFSHKAYSDKTQFIGKPGHKYSFYSIAVDHVGNRELIPIIPDVTVLILTKTENETSNFEVKAYQLAGQQKVVVELSTKETAHTLIDLYDITGHFIQNLVDEKWIAGENKFIYSLDLKEGLYFLNVRQMKRNATLKLFISK